MPRPRDRDDDDDNDRPRRRDDDDEDDRPRRPRRRRDDDPRPLRRPRRRSRGPSAGLILGIIGGVAALAVVIVLVVTLSRGGFGSADISYSKFNAIGTADSIDSLEKQFGSATNIPREEWNTTYVGGAEPRGAMEVQSGSTLATYNMFVREITAWYRWRKGQEEIYVAEGTDDNGRNGLVLKIYWNPKVLEDAILKPGGPTKPAHPWFQIVELGGRGEVRFGG
jgi:hypothetical protein